MYIVRKDLSWTGGEILRFDDDGADLGKIVEECLSHTTVVERCCRVVERQDNPACLRSIVHLHRQPFRLAVDLADFRVWQEKFHAVTTERHDDVGLDDL